jgi:hypothetical protein
MDASAGVAKCPISGWQRSLEGDASFLLHILMSALHSSHSRFEKSSVHLQTWTGPRPQVRATCRWGCHTHNLTAESLGMTYPTVFLFDR